MIISKLSDSLSKIVRASSTLCSFHCAVEEIILNSLDAGASTVEIFVDLQNLNFKVVDNGKMRIL